ncbi:unnamed protein product, partial [marine sediment metagenome]
DNIYLKTEIKASKDAPEILKARFMYGLVLVGMALMQEDSKAEKVKTENESEDQTDNNVALTLEDQVSRTSAAIAPVLLPLIESLDAFMGGGTTIVEAIANGRNALGIDINPLAYFIAKVKTTPLSARDQERILHWADRLNFEETTPDRSVMGDPRLRNIPEETRGLLVRAVSTLGQLEFPRQRRFARCALLKLGQWAIDCRKDIPSASHMKRQFLKQVVEMLEGLDDLVQAAKNLGIPKNKI